MNTRVQKIWLHLLDAASRSQAPCIQQVEEGYHAVVRRAADRPECHITDDCGDFSSVKPFIPRLSRTRAVYLNQESAYGLAGIESLRDWAGPLAKPVELGARHAFAIVDAELFARKISTLLPAPGWKVERVQDCLRVSAGRFIERANLLRAIVQMVLSRETFAEAARSLKAELAGRFAMDGRLFARFEKRFAGYRLAVIDRYFTLCPPGSRVAAGWDYWQTAGRDAREATRIFEQAMSEFESLIATDPCDGLSTAQTGAACGHARVLRGDITNFPPAIARN